MVDRDRFEPHNRAKSSHYPHHLANSSETGLPFKAEWVAGRVAHLATAPGAIVKFANTWIQDLGAAAFDDVDVVVSCVDAISARRYIVRRTMEFDRPLVTGGIKAERLWYSVYPVIGLRDERCCWNCEGVPEEDAFSCRHYARDAERAGVIPAIQTGAAALAAYMAEATIMLLHGREPTARSVAIDLRSGESMLSHPAFHPDCASRHRGMVEADPVESTRQGKLRRSRRGDRCPADDADAAGDVRRDRGMPHLPSDRSRRGASVGMEAQPHCRRRGCGGPWKPLPSRALQVPPITASEVRLDQPLAGVALAALGIAEGDRVSIFANGTHRTIKLGNGQNLFSVAGP